MESKEQEIVRTAEKMVRRGGYNSFSFREIAKVVGIKSSSVHYHFPTKADLGGAVARYYTEKFMVGLGLPEEIVAKNGNPIDVYIEAFRQTLLRDRRMCLCGLLGAEVEVLPEEVARETKAFFTRNIEWLQEAYEMLEVEGDARDYALHTLSTLEGAMILSNVLNDISAFDASCTFLRNS